MFLSLSPHNRPLALYCWLLSHKFLTGAPRKSHSVGNLLIETVRATKMVTPGGTVASA